MSEIISVVKYSNDDLDHQVFIHIGGKSYVIDRYSCFEKKSLTKQEAELICKRINTDVDKVVKDYRGELAKLNYSKERDAAINALEELLSRLKEADNGK